jgi:CDP-glycerol glycerophosphotransferase (TagB/SpsB family)
MTYAVAGYPKFETVRRERTRLFDNADPVVLYNPTQNPRGTSWHRFGRGVLDAFARRDDLNLIFAPHALLFRRSLGRGARLPRGLRTGPRLIVDTASPASFDMTYTRAADLYLGDQSSQVYEFIREPRPCVFLNASETGWQGNPDYRSWGFGPVVERIADLMPAIDAALGDFDRWRPAQEAALAQDAPRPDAPFADAPASERGARAIAEFLESGRVSEGWR